MCVGTLTDETQCGAGKRTLGKKRSIFLFPFKKKPSEMAGERVFLLSLSLSLVVVVLNYFSPRTVPKIKEFNCFSALNIWIIQHPIISGERVKEMH